MMTAKVGIWAGVILVLLIAVGIWATHRSGQEESPASATGNPPASALGKPHVPGSPGALAKPPVGAAVGGLGKTVRRGKGGAAGSAETADAPWQPEEPVEFAAEDVKPAGEGVTVDLGDHTIRAGEEFSVEVRLNAPPLESFTLVLKFDPLIVEPVAKSGKPVGKTFRKGLEYYVDAASGSVGVIHSGLPGMKNLNAATGEPACVFRLKGKASGETRLVTDAAACSFVNGRGEEERVTLHGGQVKVQ